MLIFNVDMKIAYEDLSKKQTELEQRVARLEKKAHEGEVRHIDDLLIRDLLTYLRDGDLIPRGLHI